MRFFIPMLIAILSATPAYAQTESTVTPSQQMMQQLQQLLQKSGMSAEQSAAQQKKIAMGLAVMQIKGCVEQTAGKPATDALINDITQEGKIIEGLCKQGEAAQARTQVIALMKAKEHDAAARAARMCYQDHQDAFLNINDKVSPEDLANYERWAADPQLAEREMHDSDICK